MLIKKFLKASSVTTKSTVNYCCIEKAL